MLLRNKITGEIKEFVLFDGKNELQGGATLKDLMIEWEDYEEPKEYWRINEYGAVFKIDEASALYSAGAKIGNYFNTKEEAEKVVDLLKRIEIIKSYGCNVYKYIDSTVLSIEDYYERNKDDVR